MSSSPFPQRNPQFLKKLKSLMERRPPPPGAELIKLAHYNPGHPVKFEFQIDFSISISHMLHGMYLYLKKKRFVSFSEIQIYLGVLDFNWQVYSGAQDVTFLVLLLKNLR